MLHIDNMSDKELKHAVGQIKRFVSKDYETGHRRVLNLFCWSSKKDGLYLEASNNFAVAVRNLPAQTSLYNVYTSPDDMQEQTDVRPIPWEKMIPPDSTLAHVATDKKKLLEMIGPKPGRGISDWIGLSNREGVLEVVQNCCTPDFAAVDVVLNWRYLADAIKGVDTAHVVISFNPKPTGPTIVRDNIGSFKVAIMPVQKTR